MQTKKEEKSKCCYKPIIYTYYKDDIYKVCSECDEVLGITFGIKLLSTKHGRYYCDGCSRLVGATIVFKRYDSVLRFCKPCYELLVNREKYYKSLTIGE